MFHLKNIFVILQTAVGAASILISASAFAQPDVTVGTGAGQVGATVTIPVSFVNNGNVVGMNFNILYDASVISAVDLSNCDGNDMNKGGVTCTNPSAGTITIVVATFPLAAIASTQIGTIDFTISGSAALGDTNLTIANATFSKSDNTAENPGTLTHGKITVQAEPAPLLDVTPTSLTFATEVNTTQTKTVEACNDGNANGLTFSAISIAGTGAYTQTNNCPTSAPGLAQSSCCTVTVAFAPTAIAQGINDTLNITSSHGSQAVSLTGEGTAGPAGALTITPAPYNYGNVLTNSETPTQSFTVTNTGAAGSSVDISTITVAAPFGIAGAGNTCATADLAKDETCTVSVTFTPTADGAAAGTLSVSGTDGNGDTKTATSALSGTGVTEARPTANPASGTSESEVVGPEGSFDFTVLFGNEGNQSFDVACSLTSGDNTIWTITGGANTTVGAGESHTVTSTCTLPDTETYAATVSCSIGQQTYTYNYECVGLPPLPVPVDNKWALALLALMMLMAASFGFRFITRQ